MLNLLAWLKVATKPRRRSRTLLAMERLEDRCNPAATGEIIVSDPVVLEGDDVQTALVFEVSLERTGNGTITVDYQTADGTATLADGDYEAASGSLTWNGNTEGTKTVTVMVNGDLTIEPDEYFFLNISETNQGDVTGDLPGEGTIENDDADITPPEVELSATRLTNSKGKETGGWLVYYSASDEEGGSGLATVTYEVLDKEGNVIESGEGADGQITVNGLGAGKTVKVTATDAAGNVTVEYITLTK